MAVNGGGDDVGGVVDEAGGADDPVLPGHDFWMFGCLVLFVCFTYFFSSLFSFKLSFTAIFTQISGIVTCFR